MAEKRIQFSNIVQNQLPDYTKTEFPLVSDFLKQYYLGLEYQGGPIDLVQNIDQYIKIGEQTNLIDAVGLSTVVDAITDVIPVDMVANPTGTYGFPSSYGLIQINDEIITYTGTATTCFTGCVRGFCGITSYKAANKPDVLEFKSSTSASHSGGSQIKNLSSLFLKEFLLKTKHQLLPGLEDRKLDDNLNQNLFIKQAKDFYLSKGTDKSFEILFKALYNDDVKIIKPRDFLFTPSNANYRITKDFVVESIEGEGNPVDLEQSTLFQDPYQYGNYTKAYAPITSVEPINTGDTGIGQTFYKLSIDAGYNRDARVQGSIYGDFKTHSKTRVIGRVSTGTTYLDVDSTVGFPTSGELYAPYTDGTVGIVSYTSKNLTQFFNCTNINGTIADASNIGINTYVYGSSFVDSTKNVKVRINSVIEGFEYPKDTKNYNKDDTVEIKTLGVADNSFKGRNWFYNIAPIYQVKSLEVIDSSDWTYQLQTNVDHCFVVGDRASILLGGNARATSTILKVVNSKTVELKGQGQLEDQRPNTYRIKRLILKTESNNFPESTIYATNVQNVYRKDDNFLVASSSIPSYNAQPLDVYGQTVIFSGTYIGDEFLINPLNEDHGFYTGDAVYYSPERVSESYYDDFGNVRTRIVDGKGLITEGLYFVKRVNNSRIKLATSRTNISDETFVTLTEDTVVNNSRIEPYDFRFKTLQSQNLLREIAPPQDDNQAAVPTDPGFTGVLINGVQVLNYKAGDVIKYGQLDEVEVSSPGSDYDVINPPLVHIADNVGTGATGYAAVEGSLSALRILDPGFDYEETPTVTITGGNGSGAVVDVHMKRINHVVDFFGDSNVHVGQQYAWVSLTDNTIGFNTYHRFKNAEKVIYETYGQVPIGGITTHSQYYITAVNDTKIKLHPTEAAAIAGIDTISLTDHGIGKQSFKAVNKKFVVDVLNVSNGGSGYANKKRSTPTEAGSGINTAFNSITIPRHDYKSGEVVTYTAEGTSLGGLTDGDEYYLTTVNENQFRLSQVGTTTDRTFYYRTKQYIDLTSVGLGTHTFNYPPINVNITGKVGISSIAGDTFECKVQPIIRGNITSIHVSKNGVGYGSSEIINFDRQPDITLIAGSGAQMKPIINDGSIEEILIQSTGSFYNSPPDIIINGDGVGAVLTPVLTDGTITAVKVIEKGEGYTAENTSIQILVPGEGAEFRANIQNWRLNLFQRHIDNFSTDDGIIADQFNVNRGLQYAHLYAPRKLRESVFGTDQEGNTLYGKTDLQRVNGSEVASTDHSPVIGWAYDGNPIYGPYGYSTQTGGVVTQMVSGYSVDLKASRPPQNEFPVGFFIEDYTYTKVADPKILDENNGRFCVTPEYPNGVYAYFTTLVEGQADSSGPFAGYKKPAFPFLIGENYKSTPNKFNFSSYSNQDQYELNGSGWSRNTKFYNFIEGNLQYEYVYIPDKLSQTLDIKSGTSGVIDKIGLTTAGDLYQVGDPVVFDNTGTQGNRASADVKKVFGKPLSQISVATSSVAGVEIYPSNQKGEYIIWSDKPHGFKNKDLIKVSGLSTTSSKIGGDYKVGIKSDTFALIGPGATPTGIGSDGVTGIVTYFDIRGNFTYPRVRENDILQINSEKIQVLNVEPEFSRIRALRAVEGTAGAAHSVTTVLYEDPRKVVVDAGFKTTFTAKNNKQIYFNPNESVAIGTAFGVGIGTTVSFYSKPDYPNPGSGTTEVFIPTRTIWLAGHDLNTNDKLTYSPNRGEGLKVQHLGGNQSTLTADQTLYAYRHSENLIGIATVKVGLNTAGDSIVGIGTTFKDSSTLAFVGLGTGTWHSFKTNYTPITGEISRNLVTVSTASTHGLLSDDEVEIDVSPGNISTTFTVTYNDYNRAIIINPIGFSTTGINTITNSISIQNHGLETGDKVVHTSTTPPGGLSNNGTYYVIRIDVDTFKLSDNQYNSKLDKPVVVGINSLGGGGTINPVNPHVNVYKNQNAIFDLSDASLGYINQGTNYAAFKFNFYTDKNLLKVWETNKVTKNFNVERTGRAGVDANANVTLVANDQIPTTLFYTLDPLYEGTLPPVKEQVTRNDEEVKNGGEVLIKESEYNGKHSISVGSTNSFTYCLTRLPEKASYISTTSDLKYKTESPTAFGPIADFEIFDGGENYYALPGISSITSNTGVNAVAEVSSKTIGGVKRTKIKDIGYNFPSDDTLRPSVGLPQIVTITTLGKLNTIGISSVGRGYSVAPNLKLFDGVTNVLDPDVELKYSLGDQRVTILKNTQGLYAVQPRIVPTDNTNGVGISTVGFDTSSKDVSVTLSVGFSTIGTFPFTVGDKVLIENVSVGVGTTARGYNSAEYNYKLFELTQVDPNIGGLGIVTFSMYDFYKDLDPGVTPGQFDPVNSVGRIIPEKYFPIFNVDMGMADYLKGETVTSKGATGIVENWDPRLGLLKIASGDEFPVHNIIKGQSSESAGIAASVTSYRSNFKLGPYSEVLKGWETDSGILNTNSQRIQDSLYYQNFSYSLQSKVSMNTWDDVVGALNHTLGYVRFSDMQLDSINDNSMQVGISTNVTEYDIVNHLIGIGNLHTVHDFDLVTENSLNIGSRVLSDEIVFANRVLFDYDESVGNRVLSVDDFSGEFNSNPRTTPFSIGAQFDLATTRACKYFAYVKDRRFTQQRQLQVVNVLHNNSQGLLNQYGRISTVFDMGNFDFNILGNRGRLLWYPRNYKVNDYDLTCISYHLDDNLLSVGSTSFGNVTIETDSTNALKSATRTNIVSFATTYRSAKVLLNVQGDSTVSSGGAFEFTELNILKGNGSNVDVVEYGNLTQTKTAGGGSYTSPGLGTYHTYVDGANIKIDWCPDATNVGVGSTAIVNAVSVLQGQVDPAKLNSGAHDLKHARLASKAVSMAATTSPEATVIGEYISQVDGNVEGYDAAYFVVQLENVTHSGFHMSELFVVDDYTDADGGDTFETVWGEVGASGIGTMWTQVVNDTTTGICTMQLMFKPIASVTIEAQTYMNALKINDDAQDSIALGSNSNIFTEYGLYEGTENNLKKAFPLKHKTEDIFERSITGNSSAAVDVASNTIIIPNHFFVTGEKLRYIHAGAGSTQAIGIAATDGFVGVGTTDKLPGDLFVVKIDADKIKISETAAKSLLKNPETVDITSVGIGTSHRFVSTNQNGKVMLSLDNIIQSPVVSTAVTTRLARSVNTTDDLLYFTGITSFTGSDLFKVGNEIMKIESVGVGSTNRFRVKRQWLGTTLAGHATDAMVTKVTGGYNIVDNVLNFAEAPYGNVPLSSTTNPPDSRDWTGISTGSHFNGRVFLRSGVEGSANETYYQNYILDDMSDQFNGIKNTFELTGSNHIYPEGSDLVGIATENAVILINDVFQGPVANYNLKEASGITTISFTGTASSVSSDINLSTLPIGGVLLSVGSTEGHGYQPLIGAGGTAVVSVAGTVQSVSIGYSGRGYRSGIGQTVNVGVGTTSLSTPNTQWVGEGTIGSNGTITGVAITISKGGYSQVDPPFVIIDEPLSYTNIPLEYSSESVAGVGTNATVDIVVGQGSSVIDFRLNCTGSAYREGEILTIPYGGPTGIQTDTTTYYNEFQLTVQEQFTDKFTGWSLGTLEALDDWDALFDGQTVTFPLRRTGDDISIRTSKGSKIDIDHVLLIFINDILQVPGKAYTFEGGSLVTMMEPPKAGDLSKIIFYKGSGPIDVLTKEILETVKEGDDLTIERGSNPSYLEETVRGVSTVSSTNTVKTIPYFGPGNTEDETLQRPVVWKRQTEDKIIGESLIGKDRELYNANIYPAAYLIKNVGIGSTVFYVDSVRPFFNPDNEIATIDERKARQDKIQIVNQDAKTGAIGTCLVTTTGIITSVVLSDGGYGYTAAPNVFFSQKVGTGVTALGKSFINPVGIVTGIEITDSGSDYLQTDPPAVLIEPPTSLQESDSVDSYVGDSGIIVGFGTVGTAAAVDKSLIFDIHIPYNSFMRDTLIVGTGQTLSGISTGDYFVIRNTYVGFADTSIRSLDIAGETIGIGTNFLDNVYQVDTATLHTTDGVVGLGTTTFKRITAKIAGVSTITFAATKAGFSSETYDFASAGQGAGSGWSGAFTTSFYIGDFSWGKINIAARAENVSYPAYTRAGVTGIETGGIVARSKSLMSKNYDS